VSGRSIFQHTSARWRSIIYSAKDFPTTCATGRLLSARSWPGPSNWPAVDVREFTSIKGPAASGSSRLSMITFKPIQGGGSSGADRFISVRPNRSSADGASWQELDRICSGSDASHVHCLHIISYEARFGASSLSPMIFLLATGRNAAAEGGPARGVIDIYTGTLEDVRRRILQLVAGAQEAL